MHEEFNIMMESIGSQYIEESPNQIRDLTVKLIQENYFRDTKFVFIFYLFLRLLSILHVFSFENLTN